MKINFIIDIFFGINRKNTNLPKNLVKVKNNKFFWILSFFNYKEKIIKDKIWQLKYRSNFGVAKEFGEIIGEFLFEELYYESLHKKINSVAIIFVPIHWRRFLERGFNQSYLLSKEIIKNYKKFDKSKINVRIYKNILSRKKYSKKQSWGKFSQRQKNVAGAFICKKLNQIRAVDKIILIDDVLTTGATLENIKNIFPKKIAKKILGITIAS